MVEEGKSQNPTHDRAEVRANDGLRVCEGWVHVQKIQSWGHPVLKRRWLTLTRSPGKTF